MVSDNITITKLKASDKIEVTNYGILKAYYNCMKLLVDISGNNSEVTLRGNIINTGNSIDFPSDYFSLSEVDIRNHTIQ